MKTQDFKEIFDPERWKGFGILFYLLGLNAVAPRETKADIILGMFFFVFGSYLMALCKPNSTITRS